MSSTPESTNEKNRKIIKENRRKLTKFTTSPIDKPIIDNVGTIDKKQSNDKSVKSARNVRNISGNNIEKDPIVEQAEKSQELLVDGIQSSDEETIFYMRKNMLAYYGREFICIMALLLTTYATFQNVHSNTTYIMPPVPFFTRNAMVFDFPGGELKAAQAKVGTSELSLVMFYAPWSAESQQFRFAFQQIANIFYNEINFIAINCWHPGGECRQQYSKVLSWPVLMAYLPNGLAIQYKGLWNESGLEKFVISLLLPIDRLTNYDTLQQSIMDYDAVVVLYASITNKLEYKSFLQTAYKWKERERMDEVKFSVHTGLPDKQFGITESPTIRMYLWNETIEFIQQNWSQPLISKWIVNNLQQISNWISPSGMKSRSFAKYLKSGPVLILFTPKPIYPTYNDAYSMIRQISMQYHNCAKDQLINDIVLQEFPRHRNRMRENYFKLRRKCPYNSITHSCNLPEKPISVSMVNVINASTQIDYCMLDKSTSKMIEPKMGYVGDYDCKTNNHLVSTRFKRSFYHTSIVDINYDERSAKNLMKYWRNFNCRNFDHSEHSSLFFDHLLKTEKSAELLGLGCKHNKTLSIVVMDSLIYTDFAGTLGIQIEKQPNRTAAIILDRENESSYQLKRSISTQNLIDFIQDFHSGKLIRQLVEIQRPGRLKPAVKDVVTIKTLRSREFLNYLQTNKTVVVLFYSAKCALCSLATHTLLRASDVLSGLSDLQFIRIDGDANDLPFQYSMEIFPSIIIFPGLRKSDSRIYPNSLKISLKNVLSFILANLNRVDRLHAIILICKTEVKPQALKYCSGTLQHEIYESISTKLRQWRSNVYRRHQIMRQLQMLQTIYLSLYKINHSCDFTNLEMYIRNYKKLWNAFP